jgi:hypothetical protein
LSPAGEPALKRVGPAVTLPKLSIAAKLYVIFALMAAATLALSTVAVRSARATMPPSPTHSNPPITAAGTSRASTAYSTA